MEAASHPTAAAPLDEKEDLVAASLKVQTLKDSIHDPV